MVNIIAGLAVSAPYQLLDHVATMYTIAGPAHAEADTCDPQNILSDSLIAGPA